MRYLLPKCPVCGKRAFIDHYTLEGVDMGFAIGCPSYKINDGVHGEDFRPKREGFFTATGAERWWKMNVQNYMEHQNKKDGD